MDEIQDRVAEFYKGISRRPLIDVIQEEEEQKFWAKEFEKSNDITLYSWRNDWLKNLKDNKKHFEYFNRDHSVKIFANEFINKPMILLGAGPSLQKNIKYLKMAKELGIPIMASHHALMYLAREDVKVKPDFVAVLDAGAMWDDYFAFGEMDMKDVPLLADQVCNSKQLQKWEGPISFYRSAQPDGSNVGKFLKMEIERLITIAQSGSIVEVGGHVLGAMSSIAMGVMKVDTLIFVGCDYSFSPEGKFYPFDHKIDEVVSTENPDGSFSEKPAPPGQE